MSIVETPPSCTTSPCSSTPLPLSQMSWPVPWGFIDLITTCPAVAVAVVSAYAKPLSATSISTTWPPEADPPPLDDPPPLEPPPPQAPASTATTAAPAIQRPLMMRFLWVIRPRTLATRHGRGAIRAHCENGSSVSRTLVAYACTACGHHAPKWLGRCPGGGEWKNLEEQRAAAPGPNGRPRPGA